MCYQKRDPTRRENTARDKWYNNIQKTRLQQCCAHAPDQNPFQTFIAAAEYVQWHAEVRYGWAGANKRTTFIHTTAWMLRIDSNEFYSGQLSAYHKLPRVVESHEMVKMLPSAVPQSVFSSIPHALCTSTMRPSPLCQLAQ